MNLLYYYKLILSVHAGSTYKSNGYQINNDFKEIKNVLRYLNHYSLFRMFRYLIASTF